jgi:putative DNA primase/helicase
VAYHPEAECPTWDAFLWRIMGGRQNIIDFLRRAVGYSLTGMVTEQCLFFLHGTGANGKSTFIEALATMFGDYFQKAPTEMIMTKYGQGVPNDVARLPGTRFVVAAEIEEGRQLAESLIKDLTGGDTVTARFLHREFFEFKSTHKLWMYGNHKPIVKGTDDGIWRRMRLIPFNVTIPEEERDANLPEALKTELDGILAWAVRGCLEWQHDGLGVPDEVKNATKKYRAEMDSLAEFIVDCCVEGPGYLAGAADLHKRYSAWCASINETPMTATMFGRALRERGFEKEHTRNGAIYKGIGLIGQVTESLGV